MHNSLFRKTPDIFPISGPRNLNVYVRGIKLYRIAELGDITEKRFNKLVSVSNPSVGILDKYKETALEYQELQLVLDIIKDLVKIKELSKEHLTDVELQAKFISKTFKCVCSTAQMKEAARYKNPIKVRLERIKACT